jgi:hypothetical protein
MRLTLSFDEEQEMVDEPEGISGTKHVVFAPTPSSALQTTVVTSTLSLKKIAPREIQISQHLFDHLKQTTKDQILFVYGRTMGPNTPLDRRALDSHSRIRQALRFLGVGTFENDKKSRATPDDLLTNWVHECYKLLFDWYEADPISPERLKERAFCHSWGLDELKAITAMWMVGKNEDMLLDPGRELMKIDDETRLKYRTSFNGYNTLRRTTKHSVEEGDLEEEVEEEAEEEVIREDLIQEVRSGDKINLDAHTLEMIKEVKRASDVFTGRTTRLLAHLMDVSGFTDGPRLPPSRRLMAPQPVEYPWVKKVKRRRQ